MIQITLSPLPHFASRSLIPHRSPLPLPLGHTRRSARTGDQTPPPAPSVGMGQRLISNHNSALVRGGPPSSSRGEKAMGKATPISGMLAGTGFKGNAKPQPKGKKGVKKHPPPRSRRGFLAHFAPVISVLSIYSFLLVVSSLCKVCCPHLEI